MKSALLSLIILLSFTQAQAAAAEVGTMHIGAMQIGAAMATKSDALPVLPYPQHVATGNAALKLSPDVQFRANGLTEGQLHSLKTHWRSFFNNASHKEQQVVELILLSEKATVSALLGQQGQLFADNIGQEGYLLSAREGNVRIAANTETGLFYGLQTLRQLTRAGWNSVLFIADWPAFPTRVIFDDISRGPISTVTYIKKQIERLAELKVNYLSFYIEHVVQPLSHPDFAPKDGKLTIADIKALSAYAARYHMKLIGGFQSFGHFEKILALPQYKSMGETASLISPLDPKARQFLEDVIGELCEAFNAPWFNVNCDETFDLNKGKSKAYIDSVGADRFYADHLTFLHGVLAKHGKKMMMWGDVVIQYPKVTDMLPKEVIYLTWEYGAAASYDRWIKPFAAKGVEFMVCPGVLNSYRMFPDMVMAKSNIKGFLEAGKRQGATGAFTTLWDDGGAYLFSGDWYGVYFAAEKSWNLQASHEPAFDARYCQVAYGVDNTSYVQAMFKLLELRELPLTYNMNDLLWQQDLLPEPGKSLWLNNTSVPEARRILGEASRLVAGTGARFNRDDIQTLRDAIAQYTLMMDSRRILATESARYRGAVQMAETRPAQARKSVPGSADSLTRLRERYVLLLANFRKAWLRQNQPYWLDVISEGYQVKIDALARLETALRKAASLGKGLLPTPISIGFDIHQTTHAYFSYWLISGPFPVDSAGSNPAFLYSENNEYDKPPIPGGIAIYRQKNYRWHKFASKSGGPIDLAAYFREKGLATGYAYCTLNVTGKELNEVFVTATNGTEIFCDGKRIGVINGEAASATEQSFPVSLGKGNHVFLLKIPAGPRQWTFSMRLADEDSVVNTKHKYQVNSKNKTYEVE